MSQPGIKSEDEEGTLKSAVVWNRKSGPVIASRAVLLGHQLQPRLRQRKWWSLDWPLSCFLHSEVSLTSVLRGWSPTLPYEMREWKFRLLLMYTAECLKATPSAVETLRVGVMVKTLLGWHVASALPSSCPVQRQRGLKHLWGQLALLLGCRPGLKTLD